jgi:hypothetical protein
MAHIADCFEAPEDAEDGDDGVEVHAHLSKRSAGENGHDPIHAGDLVQDSEERDHDDPCRLGWLRFFEGKD